MLKRNLLGLALVWVLSMAVFAAPDKPASAAGPDKAYLQKVLDGWSTMDPADARPFYAPGPGTFFDIAPLKYNSWDEYENGVRKVLVNYQRIKFTLNDDAVVHVHGDVAWSTSTITEDAVLKNGKHEMATQRWTVIMEKRNGKWLIVHDHTSAQAQ